MPSREARIAAVSAARVALVFALTKLGDPTTAAPPAFDSAAAAAVTGKLTDIRTFVGVA